MNPIRCQYCGFSNFPDAPFCRRCQQILRKEVPKHSGPRTFSLFSVVSFIVIAVIVYYALDEYRRSMDEVNSHERKRLELEAKDNPQNLSRTQYQQQRAGQIGNAIRNTNSMIQAERHNAELKKAIQASQGNAQK